MIIVHSPIVLGLLFDLLICLRCLISDSGNTTSGHMTTISFRANRHVGIMTKEQSLGHVQMTSKNEDQKRTAGGFVLLSVGEDNDAYIKEKDDDYLLERVEPDNIAIRIPLLSSTILPDVSNTINTGSRDKSGGCYLPKQVRIIVPSDSEEDGPDFV